MTEDIFTNNVKRIEKIYSTLIKGESNPQKEVEMRIELIDALSNIEASLISEKKHNEEFIITLTNLRELLLNWDPYGQWFKQQKNLVDTVYEVMINAKNVVFTKHHEDNSEASRLKSELDALKSELNDLRSLMSSLVKEQKPSQEKTTTIPPKQPIIDQSSQIATDLQDKPLVNEETESVSEPPIMTPIETPKKTSIKSPESSPLKELTDLKPPEDEQEVKPIVSETTLEKVEKSSEASSSAFLNQMKSIINEAEKETEKQISDFQEQFKSPKVSQPIAPDKSSMEIPAVKEPVIPPITESEETTTDTSDNWVKPTEILKQKEVEEATSTSDPYMQLLTLEAEKYRFEKEIEKNETDFQEGLKSKKEFDETIDRINKELTIIREQIDNLRKQLTS